MTQTSNLHPSSSHPGGSAPGSMLSEQYGGFEYAIQSGGSGPTTSLAERLWAERNAEGTAAAAATTGTAGAAGRYTFQTSGASGGAGGGPAVVAGSLAQIRHVVERTAGAHARGEALPDRPPPTPPAQRQAPPPPRQQQQSSSAAGAAAAPVAASNSSSGGGATASAAVTSTSPRNPYNSSNNSNGATNSYSHSNTNVGGAGTGANGRDKENRDRCRALLMGSSSGSGGGSSTRSGGAAKKNEDDDVIEIGDDDDDDAGPPPVQFDYGGGGGGGSGSGGKLPSSSSFSATAAAPAPAQPPPTFAPSSLNWHTDSAGGGGNASNGIGNNGDNDAFDDDMFAALDVDAIVSQHQAKKQMSQQQQQPPSQGYANQGGGYQSQSRQQGYSASGGGGGGYNGSANPYSSASYGGASGYGNGNGNNYGGGSSSNNINNSTSFGGGGGGVGDDFGASGHMSLYGGGSSTAGGNYNGNGYNNDGYQQGNSGGYGNDGYGDYGGSASAWGNSAGGSYDGGPSSWGGGTNNMSSAGGDGSAPLCSGHGVPCCLLTASTAQNSGRQFYKCSFPEAEQCDFFEWADGMEGSLNPAAAVQGAEMKDMHTESRRKFGHHSFREGQEKIIRKALEGRDVFVLMPTGGGKSLCYQLPAWCAPGLSVVVSPLLSLIQDQVQSMTKLGVESVFLSSAQDWETQRSQVVAKIRNVTPHGGVKLLYITPEMLNRSGMIKGILSDLCKKGLVSRFVVDEAHCLSDWGHDFRKDYMSLSCLRKDYPGVPLMALTATANQKVVEDAIRVLGMHEAYLYRSSFNRPNLAYEVRKKDGKTIDVMAEYIATRRHESGVIYCLSRKDCETVCDKLQAKLREKNCGNVGVSFYHAELDPYDRKQRHHAWSTGKISVLCATIAFGMGEYSFGCMHSHFSLCNDILTYTYDLTFSLAYLSYQIQNSNLTYRPGIDKPDVRYVMHYSMPKSITHYYQESGRAGRDGDKADCILFYAYKDKKVLEMMIRKSSTDPFSAATRKKIDQLYSCLRYCQNEFLCRRTMQLEFFGETFNRVHCNKTCDNCRSGKLAEKKDLSDLGRTILQLLSDVQAQKSRGGVTLVALTMLLRGSKAQTYTKFIDTTRLRGYGAASKHSASDVERIMHSLVFQSFLVEISEENASGFNSDYVQEGDKAPLLVRRQVKFQVDFPKDPPKAKDTTTGKKKAAKKSATTKSASTKKGGKKKTATGKDKSSGSKKKKAAKSSKSAASTSDFIISDDDIEDDDGEFEDPTFERTVGAKSKSPEKTVLPKQQTEMLMERIKKLLSMWADEERMSGNNVYCK